MAWAIFSACAPRVVRRHRIVSLFHVWYMHAETERGGREKQRPAKLGLITHSTTLPIFAGTCYIFWL